MKNKKGPTIAVILLIIFIIIFGFLTYTFFSNLKNPNKNITKKDFEVQLTKMGESIYKDYYYEIIKVDRNEKELQEYLKMFEKIGLTFNLVELSKYSDDNNEKIEAFINNNKGCSRESSAVIIYPKNPYSKTDFTVEARIECNDSK